MTLLLIKVICHLYLLHLQFFLGKAILRNFIYGRFIVDEEVINTNIVKMINDQGWSKISHLKCNVHESMVMQFYDGLSVSNGIVCSTVNGHRIRLDEERFNTLFDLHPTPDHVKIFCAQGWPSMVDAEINTVCGALWAEAGIDNFTPRMTPYLRQVNIATRIEIKMINDLFVCRKTHDNRINFL